MPFGIGRGAGLSVQAACEGSSLGDLRTGVFCLPSSFASPFLELQDLGLGCFLLRVRMAGFGFGAESKRGREREPGGVQCA